jgi:hypothetical protein
MRRHAVGAGMVLLVGGIGVAAAAPSQAATPPDLGASVRAVALSRVQLGLRRARHQPGLGSVPGIPDYCFAPWQPGVDYLSCPVIVRKG